MLPHTRVHNRLSLLLALSHTRVRVRTVCLSLLTFSCRLLPRKFSILFVRNDAIFNDQLQRKNPLRSLPI